MIHQGKLQDLIFFLFHLSSKVKADSSAPRMEGMFFLLLLLFLAVPLAEILVIVEVAQKTGILETIGLLLIVSILGAWLVKSEGMGVIRKIQFQLVQGQIPSKELLDGGLILIAGVMMLTPGFITDALGLLLLFPLTRPIIRRLFFKRIVNQPINSTGSGSGQNTTGFGRGSFVHMDSSDIEIVDLRRENDIPHDPPTLES
tara:strand:- start:5186 stop:5788 length:603 start_codon:yes stop_codon:yes gene_type:complete